MKVRFTMSDAENTFEAILGRMKSNLELDMASIEGTWTGDLLQAVANELARIYSMEIRPMYDKAFVRTARGGDLDNCCADYGIERNPATAAEGLVTITGKPGTYKGLRVVADDVVFEVRPEEVVIPDTGTVDVKCTCTEPGTGGNVPAGAVNRLLEQRTGIESVLNAADISGGYDAESDESLRDRTLEHISDPGTSGNIANYREWALAVSGVENVQVFDLARGNGTVDVVITADGNTVAPPSLLAAVQEHIEKYRPVGADVIVYAAAGFGIEVTATVRAKRGYDGALLSALFYPVLQEYLVTLNQRASIVSFLKIADLLFSSEGIADVAGYSVNGARKSITIPDRYFPVAVMPVIQLEG